MRIGGSASRRAMGADARVPPILLKCGGSSGGIRAHNNEGWSQELVEEEENRSASLKSKIKILVRVNFFYSVNEI